MNLIITMLVLSNLTSLFLGMIIAYLTYKIGKKYHDQFLLTLSLGFSLIAFGSFIELVLFGLNLDTDLAHLLESIVLIMGLGIIANTLIIKGR